MLIDNLLAEFEAYGAGSANPFADPDIRNLHSRLHAAIVELTEGEVNPPIQVLAERPEYWLAKASQWALANGSGGGGSPGYTAGTYQWGIPPLTDGWLLFSIIANVVQPGIEWSGGIFGNNFGECLVAKTLAQADFYWNNVGDGDETGVIDFGSAEFTYTFGGGPGVNAVWFPDGITHLARTATWETGFFFGNPVWQNPFSAEEGAPYDQPFPTLP